MEAQYDYDNLMSYMMIPRKEEPLPLFPPRKMYNRPASQATEIFEDEDCFDESPMQSVASFGTGTLSSASTSDHVVTPESTGLTAFDFHIDDKHVRGPSGPHLFRDSMASDHKSALEVNLFLQEEPARTTASFHHRVSVADSSRKDTPVPNLLTEYPETEYNTATVNRASTTSNDTVSDWSPQDVVTWLRSVGFEEDVIQKFYWNDISGSILLELQAEDLKELEITSFGKRRRLMSSIQTLRDNVALSASSGTSLMSSSISSTQPSTARTSTNLSSSVHQQCYTTDRDSSSGSLTGRHQRGILDADLKPGDSVSIVAIEQLLPKAHKCSKGEGCRKWQKQQAKLARLAHDLPIDSLGGRAIVAGDPGNPKTAPNLLKSPRSEITPSLAASSDAMGYNHSSAYKLSQEKLKAVQPRDPQENVRNYLNFQSLDKLQTVNAPPSPPRDFMSPPACESPDSAKVTPTLAENLRHLPRLQIPSLHKSDVSSYTGGLSAQRTVTPSILSRRDQFTSDDMTAIPHSRNGPAHGATMSPGDLYRLDPCYRQDTPMSDTDAPVTALPIGPVAREDSQSVPPNMRFGNEGFRMIEPLARSSSSMGNHHTRRPSAQLVVPLRALPEGRALRPIETPEDLQRTPRAPSCRKNSQTSVGLRDHEAVTHCGWMKKRKTTRLLRHEWQDHHFTLKGTQLAMHDDEESAHRNSKALQYIDVDDYAVACSSLASSSKLSAAFKKTVLKRRDNAEDNSAFAFSLIPAPNNGGGLIDRKAMLLNGGKSHHFAVNTRDERIEWMREVMLAKTTKRALQGGNTININGNNMI
ncbi:Sterile alpha motiftype 2 [Penicillium diatomitis]|uniref:Sterile alpha motiftype 2 n=1 Tax=Penicillium diatomitis TaxID=2819901 RepID=A0A9W9X1G1_9EURO|nr:Sterile alpha motiftype 2 [Penicillium diatomitis]KAJ5480660.1 Sterile alpha motiftype 2 [Penicillium diatomitis]